MYTLFARVYMIDLAINNLLQVINYKVKPCDQSTIVLLLAGNLNI